MFVVRVCPVLILCLFALSAKAQQASRPTVAPMGVSAADNNMTAEELAVNASQAYQARNYAQALTLYRKFIEQFGEAIEAKEPIRQMRYPMAMCLFHLKKFSEAIEAIDFALGVQPPLQNAQRQDLTFWKGVCYIQEQDYENARKTFEQFLTLFIPNGERDPRYVQDHPAILKVPEAKLLIGSCFLLENKYKEAAEYLAAIKPSLISVNRGRATVMQLRALVEGEDYDGANKLITEEYPRMSEIVELISFQTLVLQLGSIYLEKGEYRKAIIALQRVWEADRLLRHQQERLADMETKLAALEANANSDPYAKLVYAQLIRSVKYELKQFQAMPTFDSALRLRLAYAFQKMERYRECALVMEAMLKNLPPDPVVESASVNLVQCWGVIEAWPKAVEAAQLFVEKFPESKQVPLVLYLQGGAEEKQFHYDEAVACYDEILNKYPSSDYAPRALFMKGFTLLLADRPKEGIACFEAFQRAYPDHEMADANAYWRGMGYSIDKQYAKSRSVMDEYLAQRKEGAYRGGATYRKAYCAQQLEDYQTSIKELISFIKAYPKSEDNVEARILLADALMNEGQMDEGIAYLKSIPSTIPDRQGIQGHGGDGKISSPHGKLSGRQPEEPARGGGDLQYRLGLSSGWPT
jgi:tetratricopeptide (TPR) repeat protein